MARVPVKVFWFLQCVLINFEHGMLRLTSTGTSAQAAQGPWWFNLSSSHNFFLLCAFPVRSQMSTDTPAARGPDLKEVSMELPLSSQNTSYPSTLSFDGNSVMMRHLGGFQYRIVVPVGLLSVGERGSELVCNVSCVGVGGISQRKQSSTRSQF